VESPGISVEIKTVGIKGSVVRRLECSTKIRHERRTKEKKGTVKSGGVLQTND